MSISRQIIKQHLVEGALEEGNEIAIKIDQTLTQDVTGTIACLQFEALNLPKVKTELSVSYADHNITKTGKQNYDLKPKNDSSAVGTKEMADAIIEKLQS